MNLLKILATNYRSALDRLSRYKHNKCVCYLSKKHDKICQLLVRFVRLQFEDLDIGLVVSVLLQKLFKGTSSDPLLLYIDSTRMYQFTNEV